MTISLDNVTVVFAHAAWFDATSFGPLVMCRSLHTATKSSN
jgi:hypothetical protein